MLATLGGTKYIARGSVDTAANVRKTKQYIKRAFEAQLRGDRFHDGGGALALPDQLADEPVEAAAWVASDMVPAFPLGEIKNELAARRPAAGGEQ